MSGYKSIKPKVISILEKELPKIQRDFGIETIGLFGSVSRGEDTPKSDIDILYRFQNDNEISTEKFLDFADYLESVLGRHVELVAIDFIDPYLRPYIRKDAILYGSQGVTV